MKIKLIAMDFDGTLLNDEKQITEKTRSILIKCKKKGYIMVGITARNLESVKRIFTQISIAEVFDYLILNNGTYIEKVKSGKGKYIGSLTKKQVQKITKGIEDDTEEIDYISVKNYYLYKNKNAINEPFIKNINQIEEIQEPITRMNIFLKDQSKIEWDKEMINHKYKNINCFIMQDAKFPEKWLVVNPKNVNKKNTLKYLGKQLGIPLNKMIFFGDSWNDIEVMGSVGCSVAMKNALEEIKQKADRITLSNNEDGVAVFLERYLEKEE